MNRRGLFATVLALPLALLAPKARAVVVRSGFITPLRRIYVDGRLIWDEDALQELIRFFKSIKGRGHEFRAKAWHA